MNERSIGWNKIKLGLLGDFSKGSGITKNDLVQDGLPCVRYAELYTKFDFIIPFCISFISEETAKTAKPIQKGDILFAGSGETKEEIGKCAVYLNDCCAYAGGDNIIFRTKQAEPLYLSFYLNTLGRKQLNKLGQGDSIVHIHSDDLKNVIIPLPPLPEQEKIAEILGTWDTAIEKLSALIEQKKRLKKGLMQRLLTGKQRLPGFSAPWKKVKLGEIIKEFSDKTTTNNQYQILSVTKNGICSQDSYFDKQIASENNIGYKIIYKHNIAFSPMNLWMGSIGFSEYDIGIVSPAYKIFKINEEKMNYIFLKNYLVTSYMIYLYTINSEIGASVVRRNLDLSALLSSLLPFPPLPEQKAIADILSKADEEIALLTRKLSALKTQKTGLMQKLLTGQIRVKAA